MKNLKETLVAFLMVGLPAGVLGYQVGHAEGRVARMREENVIVQAQLNEAIRRAMAPKKVP